MYDIPTPPRSASPGSPPQQNNALHLRTIPRRRKIQAVLMRAGTSKGLFFRASDLPVKRDEWQDILSAAMGSPDCFQKQLNGMGGGVSTQSKVAVVGPSKDPRADVDYTFVQVPVDDGRLDFSGNCGNMASGVGPFAVEEGLVAVKSGDLQEFTVRIRNVNTNRIIHSTFLIQDGYPVELGDLGLDGVSGKGSPIRLDFIDPAGSMTGKLLPTGSPFDLLKDVPCLGRVMISCVDAANPFVFVHREVFGFSGSESNEEIMASAGSTLMEIRARAAILMGLSETLDDARRRLGTPKIALVGEPCDCVTVSGRDVYAEDIDVWVRPFSMGRPHPALQMTGAVCVAAAAAVPGTLIHDIHMKARAGREYDDTKALRIGHASGTIATDSEVMEKSEGSIYVRRGSVYRTARRLMEGTVLYAA